MTRRIAVYFVLQNDEEACLIVQQLHKHITGMLGRGIDNNSDGDFVNLTITKE